MEPLVAEEGTCDTTPTVIVMILDGKFLCHGIHELALVQLHKVEHRIVLVHLHIVVQILIARGGIDVGITTLVVDVKSYREQMATIVVGQIGRRVLGATCGHVVFAVCKSVLSHPLIVGCERNHSAGCLLADQLQTCSCLVSVVGTLARSLVVLKSILSVIESRYRICSQSFSLAIMAKLCHAPEMVSNTHLYICTLIVQRTLGVNPY